MKTGRPKPAFDHCAGDYAQYRPGYPAALFERLRELCPVSGRNRVADMGSGTGLLARGLVDRGYRVIAVEPSIRMLGEFGGSIGGWCRDVHAVCATAEHSGLASRSVAMITCAQSFHWFNPPVALAEFGRVLRPGGALVLTWNNRDRGSSRLVAEFEELVRRYNPAYDVDYRRQDWGGQIEGCGLFEPARYQEWKWGWQRRPEEFIGFTRSVSYIRNVISRARIGRFEAELDDILNRHAVDGGVCIPMCTECWSAVRR